MLDDYQLAVATSNACSDDHTVQHRVNRRIRFHSKVDAVMERYNVRERVAAVSVRRAKGWLRFDGGLEFGFREARRFSRRVGNRTRFDKRRRVGWNK